jgi:alkylated DNA repair protein (DNA oxidative demethylase)
MPLTATQADASSLAPGAWLLRGFALPMERSLTSALAAIAEAAPFRHLEIPGGLRMSVASTNCGEWGWMSDRRGYRYCADDPLTGRPWPDMPPEFRELAASAAAAAQFPGFVPDACLINEYQPRARMGLHQDKDERDFTQPIVSVSLGLPATFLLGGGARRDKPRRIGLGHGDVVVFGGPARLLFHGVAPVRPGVHPLLGARRINLTFRRSA